MKHKITIRTVHLSLVIETDLPSVSSSSTLSTCSHTSILALAVVKRCWGSRRKPMRRWEDCLNLKHGPKH